MLSNEWVKSRYSGSTNANCVECRTDTDNVMIRDTQNRDLGFVSVSQSEWTAFIADIETL